MNQIIKDPVKRELIKQQLIAKFAAIAAKTNSPEAADQWKPEYEYPIYVVYLYDFTLNPKEPKRGGPYCVGFDSEIKAQMFVAELKTKPTLLDVTTCDSYPWEVMESGSKKPNKQKSKPKKPGPENV